MESDREGDPEKAGWPVNSRMLLTLQVLTTSAEMQYDS